MTVNEAMKDIQDIYDSIQSLNKNIQDVSVDDAPAIEKELYAVFAENHITKYKPEIKKMLEYIITTLHIKQD